MGENAGVASESTCVVSEFRTRNVSMVILYVVHQEGFCSFHIATLKTDVCVFIRYHMVEPAVAVVATSIFGKLSAWLEVLVVCCDM